MFFQQKTLKNNLFGKKQKLNIDGSSKPKI